MTSTMQNFVLDLKWKNDQTYELEVLESPVGEGNGTLILPFTYEEMEAWAVDYGLIINVNRGKRTLPPKLIDLKPEDVGFCLYNALFTDKVKELFDKTRTHCEVNQQKLRLVLRFNTQSETHLTALSIPWELLCDPSTNTFLCINKDITLVRHLEQSHKKQRPPLPTPLHVLAVVPNPQNSDQVSPFNCKAIKESLRNKLDQRHIKLHILEQPTIDDLYEHLLVNTYQVLHFTGHGGHDDDNWVLIFEDEDGGIDIVDEQRFVDAIQPCETLRLVHLVSCDTGRADQQQRFSPFSGLAHALMAGEMPAVVAMQFPLREDDAQRYIQSFYDRIAKGVPLDLAVDTARGKLRIAKRDRNVSKGSIAWATPVVYLRDRNAELFLPPTVQKVHVNSVCCFKQVDIQDINDKGYRLVALDDFFQNDTDATKSRKVKYPEAWNEITAKLSDLRATLNPNCPVHFEGHSFLSIWFALGHCFQQSTSFELAAQQYNQKTREPELWRPDPHEAPMAINQEWTNPGNAKDIVLSINLVNESFEKDVAIYLAGSPLADIPWLKLGILGPDRRRLAGEQDANAFCNAVIAKIRNLAVNKIHLFLDVPAAVALFIAQETSLSAQFQVYEFQKPGYTLAFVLN